MCVMYPFHSFTLTSYVFRYVTLIITPCLGDICDSVLNLIALSQDRLSDPELMEYPDFCETLHQGAYFAGIARFEYVSDQYRALAATSLGIIVSCCYLRVHRRSGYAFS